MNTLKSPKDFIEGCKKKPKKPLKNDKERKKWIKETYPEVKFVKHPVSGADVIPVEDKTVMLVGSRHGVKREREEECESRAEAKEAMERAAETMDIGTNRKAGLGQSKRDGG